MVGPVVDPRTPEAHHRGHPGHPGLRVLPGRRGRRGLEGDQVAAVVRQTVPEEAVSPGEVPLGVEEL